MRTALTLAAIALGVASLILAGGYVEDTLMQLREATIKSRLGHLQIYKAGLYASGGQRPFDYLIEDAPAMDKAIRALPGVVAQARRLSFSGLISNGRGDLPIWGEGSSPSPRAASARRSPCSMGGGWRAATATRSSSARDSPRR